MLTVYVLGCFVALVQSAVLTVFLDKELTLKGLILTVLIVICSWLGVLFGICAMLDSKKDVLLWEKGGEDEGTEA